MARRDVLQSHLEALMGRVLELDRVPVDDRGQVLVQAGGVPVRVRLRPGGRSDHVEVYGAAVSDVPLDPGLLEELNTLNQQTCRSRFFWVRDTVIVAGEADALGAGEGDLGALCDEVSGWLRSEGPRLAEKYGGRAARADDEDDEEPA